MPPPSPLRQLADLISAHVDKIDAVFAREGATFPSLDAPFNPGEPAQALAMSPEVMGLARVAIAAAGQLTSTLTPPPMNMSILGFGGHITACLGASAMTNTPEILREAGPQGLHVNDIAKLNGVQPRKMASILRLLATHHIYREVAPDVFANNRHSSVMDTRKSVAELKANPKEKHTGTPGMCALVEHLTDESLKGIAYLPDSVLDHDFCHSDDVTNTTITLAYPKSGRLPSWEWMDLPENAYRLARFNIAMDGTRRIEQPGAILKGFDWKTLPQDALLVDVGGGIGSSSLDIIRAAPHVKIVVQDRPSVIEQAKPYWSKELPDAVRSGRVVLQEHDFFQAQPVKDAAVFMLRLVVHDWPDALVKPILKALRESATPKTTLVVVDKILSYACEDAAGVGSDVPGYDVPPAPAPLLPNFGTGGAFPYLLDVQMTAMLNSQERTIGQFKNLYRECGWKIERVHIIPGSPTQQAVCVPM